MSSFGVEVEQESLYYQPRQCTTKEQSPNNYHRFALLHAPKMVNFTSPLEDDVLLLEFFLKQRAPSRHKSAIDSSRSVSFELYAQIS